MSRFQSLPSPIFDDRRPLFTVVVTCLNQSGTVVETLDSVAAQTVPFELIVTDDGSTDGSQDVISAWLAEHRLAAHFIRHDQRRGLCATLNEALRATAGHFLAMVAGDDLWEPHRLEAHAQAFTHGVAVVYSDASVIDAQGRVTHDSYLRDELLIDDPADGDLFDQLALRNRIPGMAATIRVDSLLAVGGYDEEMLFEDWDAWLRLAAAGWRFTYVPGVVARYRLGVGGTLTAEHIRGRSVDYTASVARLLLRQAGKSPAADKAMRPLVRESLHAIAEAGHPATAELLRHRALWLDRRPKPAAWALRATVLRS